MKLLILFIALIGLASCGVQDTYSPLDSYIKARINGDKLTTFSKVDAQKFIDSSNNAHILIHLHRY